MVAFRSSLLGAATSRPSTEQEVMAWEVATADGMILADEATTSAREIVLTLEEVVEAARNAPLRSDDDVVGLGAVVQA